MGSTSPRSAASRSSFLLTRRRPQPKQPQHMFGWLSKKPLGCDLTVSASWPSILEQEPCAPHVCRRAARFGVDHQSDAPPEGPIGKFFREIIEIADDSSGNYITTSDGKRIVDHESIQRSRLRVDARKWAAARLAP